MGNNPQSFFELCPSAEDREQAYAAQRYQEFRDAIVQPEHIDVTPLRVPLKRLYDISAPLAMRQDYSFGVNQILFALLRVSNRDFGIVKSYGDGMPMDGFTFLVGLTDEPYLKRPEYLTHLDTKHEVDMTSLGSDIVITMGKHGIWAHKKKFKRLGRGDEQSAGDALITTDVAWQAQSDESILRQEVGIWAPPPSELKEQARLAIRDSSKGKTKELAGVSSGPVAIGPSAVNSKKMANIKPKRRSSKADHRRQVARIIDEGLAAYQDLPAYG